MKNIVVYSADPYLLMRLTTELQMEKMRFDKEWNDMYHPFDRKFPPINYMLIDWRGKIQFHSHKCEFDNPIRLHLTEANYLEWLKLIIKIKNTTPLNKEHKI